MLDETISGGQEWKHLSVARKEEGLDFPRKHFSNWGPETTGVRTTWSAYLKYRIPRPSPDLPGLNLQG